MNMAITMAAPTKRLRSDRTAKRRSAKPPKRWLVRGLSAAAIGVLGAFSITHSMAFLMRSSNAAAARQLAPYDGRITAFAAAFRANPEATPRDRYEADALARRALQQDPTAVIAASTLGLNAQVRGQDKIAHQAFGYAETLSRRDMQMQLWAIEDAVQRNDIVGALKHYDTALRVTPSLADMLFPVLASASNDPEIRPSLIKMLLAKPPWSDGFIIYVSSNGADPKSTAQMLTSIARLGSKIPGAAQANMVGKLTDTGLLEDAWNYYAATHRDVDRRMSRDPHFAAQTDDPTVFDWAVLQSTGISSSIQRNGSQGVFDFAAPAMIGGRLLQQAQLLLPGTYRLVGHSVGIEQVETSRPYWSLSCQEGREIGRVSVPNSDQKNGRFEGTFTVPQGCPVQVLTLVARPSEAVGGLSGQFDYVQVLPVNGIVNAKKAK